MTQREIEKFLDNTKVYVNGKSKEIQNEENGELKVIGVAVSTDRLNDFVKGHIDLLMMFTSSELEDSIFNIYIKEDGIYAEHYNGVLDSSMLPDEGYFYNTKIAIIP